jgi:hypothetical protein
VLGVAVLGHRHRGRPVDDEIGPALLGEGDVLDQPAEGQLAHGGALPRLVVGEPMHRVDEEAPVGGEALQQVVTLVRRHEENSRTGSGHFLT